MGHEWMSYSQKSRTLRVTTPKGQQRSTYFLNLPLQYSLSLLIVSCLTSWLTSQMLFPVEIQIMDGPSFSNTVGSIITCGYSPGAMVIGIIVGSALTSVVFLLGLRKFPDTMPLAGTSSAAIAAACHVLPKDEDCALKPVKWGVVGDEDGIAHCSFSAGPVEPLVEGEVYR